MKWFFLFASLVLRLAFAQDSYADDDSHNHDGSHPETAQNCGSNYMLPGSIARIGSHSFLILGEAGENHIWADHRSGTPPHNYHYILRVRLDSDEMAFYKKLKAESKLLPAFTTIYFDDNNPKKQLDRSFFCLSDLPQIFGQQQKKGDAFEKLFPIRASLQKNADFEGAFEIEKSIYPGGHFTLNREDVELVVYRYLPSYLEQTAFRKSIQEQPSVVLPLLTHAPSSATEAVEEAQKKSSYAMTDAMAGGSHSAGGSCPADYYLKKSRVPKTIHSFLLLSEVNNETVLAVHYYDQAPHNFQTALHLKLSPEEMQIFRQAKAGTSVPPLFQTQGFFCMAEIKNLIKDEKFKMEGPVFKNSNLNEYKLGESQGQLSLKGSEIQVLVNRNLLSLMNPLAVARDVFNFQNLSELDPSILVEMRYSTTSNFLGRRVSGYAANLCYLTQKAAMALVKVQKQLATQGLSLLVLDCYRPERAVREFVQWAKASNEKLLEQGYIADQSGHSRGSTVDLTLSKAGKPVDMGTEFDFFGEKAHTNNQGISLEAQKNRQILKAAMEKNGFINYAKEWWHYTLKSEPFKTQSFDFEVR